MPQLVIDVHTSHPVSQPEVKATLPFEDCVVLTVLLVCAGSKDLSVCFCSLSTTTDNFCCFLFAWRIVSLFL